MQKKNKKKIFILVDSKQKGYAQKVNKRNYKLS